MNKNKSKELQLEACGFSAFVCNANPTTGTVDVATLHQHIASDVTQQQALQIIDYLYDLEKRVKAHIEDNYEDK